MRNSLTDETQADLLPYPKRMETLQKHSSFCLLDFPGCTLRCVIASPFQVSGRKIGVHCQCWILLQFLICLFTQKNRHIPRNNSHQGSCVCHLILCCQILLQLRCIAKLFSLNKKNQKCIMRMHLLAKSLATDVLALFPQTHMKFSVLNLP